VIAAYCCRNGIISFAPADAVPAGMLELHTVPNRFDRPFRDAVSAIAWHVYQADDAGGRHQYLLVPGVPNADGDEAALAAARLFSQRLRMTWTRQRFAGRRAA
jgi:hypothetical protein